MPGLFSEDLNKIKNLVDPFTGCFISFTPITLVYLRFGLKAMSLFDEGKTDEVFEFVHSGSKRISAAVDFSFLKGGKLKEKYENERRAWKLFYDTMSVIDDSIRAKNHFGLELRQRALNIVNGCLLRK